MGSVHCVLTYEFTSDLQACDEDLQGLLGYVTVFSGDVLGLGTHPRVKTLPITLTTGTGGASYISTNHSLLHTDV